MLSKFAQEYKKRFKAEANIFGGVAWDSIYLARDAIKHVGPDRAKIRDYLENNIKNWSGVVGIFNISPTDHTGLDHSVFIMVQVRNGDWAFAP